MGFQLIDPTEGQGTNAGRARLSETIRVRLAGATKNPTSPVLVVTLSQDICDEYHLSDGSKVNILLGTDEDFGTFCIAPSVASDKQAYTLNRPGKASHTLKFSIVAKKLYGVLPDAGEYIDCKIARAKRGIFATFPASALPFQPIKQAEAA